MIFLMISFNVKITLTIFGDGVTWGFMVYVNEGDGVYLKLRYITLVMM